MGLEIERRFLFDPNAAPQSLTSMNLKQAYLSLSPEVRIRSLDATATITVKTGTGIVRGEWEYIIPMEDAAELMGLTSWSVIEKRRSVAYFAGLEWTLDEYLGENSGLYVAEIEISDRHDDVSIPSWIGTEITYDSRYNASFLAQCPYSRWTT